MKEFSGLPLFAKIVELKSFANAARQLQLPTTTLSRKIQQLEADLGGKLLNRNTRALSLTELGERVLPKALLILETLNELQNEAEDISTQPIGKLHITAPRSFSSDILVPLLSQFRRAYPHIKLELDAANRTQDLTKERLDFAFRVGELADSSLIALPLCPIDYELVAEPKWLASQSTVNHPRDLTALASIRNHVDGFILPWQLSRDGKAYLPQFEADLLCDDLHASLVYALNGVGVAYLPYALVRESLQQGRLVTLLPDWQRQPLMLNLLYPNRDYLPQKSKLFLAFIKQHVDHFRQQMTKPSV